MSSRLDDKAKICVSQLNENRVKGGKQCLEFGNEIKINCHTSVQKDIMILEGKTIRRLTEIECERLQGFPDNWTKFGIYNGKIREIAKTHRYKICGNAVTVKVVEVIGRKLVK
jgi:DNA (cytosine-5)-methyltransferase 1